MRECLEKVTIYADKVDLLLKLENGTEKYSIPIQFRTYGGKKLILDAAGKDAIPEQASKNSTLITALIRAHKWERALENSKKTLRGIAIAEGLDPKYVAKIYRLNFLAPKIKEAILDGMQPRTLTLSKLMGDMPLRWQEQIHFCGF